MNQLQLYKFFTFSLLFEIIPSRPCNAGLKPELIKKFS